jgi:hypothetical protein
MGGQTKAERFRSNENEKRKPKEGKKDGNEETEARRENRLTMCETMRPISLGKLRPCRRTQYLFCIRVAIAILLCRKHQQQHFLYNAQLRELLLIHRDAPSSS